MPRAKSKEKEAGHCGVCIRVQVVRLRCAVTMAVAGEEEEEEAKGLLATCPLSSVLAVFRFVFFSLSLLPCVSPISSSHLLLFLACPHPLETIQISATATTTAWGANATVCQLLTLLPPPSPLVVFFYLLL